MANARVFFALVPPADTAAAIDRTADGLNCDGRRIWRDKLHLTLAFLGLVEHDAVASLCRQASAIQTPAFALTLDRVGYFRRPRILWLGASCVPQTLTELVATLAQIRVNGSTAGETKPPPFRAHVSVARRAAPPDGTTHIAPIEWPVREFCLVESGHGGTPGDYSVLGRWPLGLNPQSME